MIMLSFKAACFLFGHWEATEPAVNPISPCKIVVTNVSKPLDFLHILQTQSNTHIYFEVMFLSS